LVTTQYPNQKRFQPNTQIVAAVAIALGGVKDYAEFLTHLVNLAVSDISEAPTVPENNEGPVCIVNRHTGLV
jgi:hypothetical protein